MRPFSLRARRWAPSSPLTAAETPQVLEIRLNQGDDVDAPDASGWTPLMYAAQNGQVGVCLRVRVKVLHQAVETFVSNHGLHLEVLVRAVILSFPLVRRGMGTQAA